MKNLEDMTLEELFLLYEKETGEKPSRSQKTLLATFHMAAIRAYGRGLAVAQNALQEPLLEWAHETIRKAAQDEY